MRGPIALGIAGTAAARRGGHGGQVFTDPIFMAGFSLTGRSLAEPRAMTYLVIDLE